MLTNYMTVAEVEMSKRTKRGLEREPRLWSVSRATCGWGVKTVWERPVT